jgi:hypothetical protein
MDVFVVLAVIALVVAAAAAYFFWSARTARSVPVADRVLPAPRVAGLKVKPLAEPFVAARAQAPDPKAPPQVAPAPLFDLDLDLEPPVSSSPPAEITWWKKFDGRSGMLDDTARMRLIGDLGVVAKEWCVPLLADAYHEERRPGHRQAALIALTACHSRAAATTFRVALASGDAAERAIAADGLADLEPPAPQAAKIRHTVERH